MSAARRYCVIGAGYAGNGVAKAFSDAGIAYDHIERKGRWLEEPAGVPSRVAPGGELAPGYA
jgi:cation diffusion facilitator CzcD-associated flavoprotein CzcO